MSEDVTERRAKEFLARFTPPEAVREWHEIEELDYDAHGLLYDFKHRYHFTPTTAQLEECVESYVKLLEEVTSEFSFRILGLINASELALAYLVRAGESQALSVSKGVRDRLAVQATRIVTDVRSFMGGRYDGDAVKRLVSINEYLKGEVPADKDQDILQRVCHFGDQDFMLKLEQAAEEEEARHTALKENVLDYLRDNNGEAVAFTIWYDLSARFPGENIISPLFELIDEGKIKADKELLRSWDMWQSTKLRLSE